MLTRNSAENDGGKLIFPAWQDHSQDKVEFLLQREEILQPCAPPIIHASSSVNKYYKWYRTQSKIY